MFFIMDNLISKIELESVSSLVSLLEDAKAQDIVVMDVHDKTIVADYFVICSGRSVTHVKSICDHVEEHAPDIGLELVRDEGYPHGRWVVMDFAYILLHIFLPEEREYYNMERLYKS